MSGIIEVDIKNRTVADIIDDAKKIGKSFKVKHCVFEVKKTFKPKSAKEYLR